MKIDIPDYYIENNLIYRKEHPILPLYIYNYSHEVNFKGLWDRYTLMARGLILDENNNIIARPIPKFFNLEEVGLENLPKEPYIITEMVDGSLIIITRYEDELVIASRGSFTSSQAKKAKDIFESKYDADKIGSNKTFLFEVIYPEDETVVRYNDEDLIGLATVDNETGVSEEISRDHGFSVPKYFSYSIPIKDLKNSDRVDKSRKGFVIRFTKSDLRVKIKFDRYVKSYKKKVKFNAKTVWEILRNGEELSKSKIPNEFTELAKEIESRLRKQYKDIVDRCKKDFRFIKQYKEDFQARKEIAEYFNKKENPEILFSMLDNRDYSELVWKKIKPKINNECNT